MCTMTAWCQKVSNRLGLVLEMVVSHQVSDGNQIWGPCKSNRCS